MSNGLSLDKILADLKEVESKPAEKTAAAKTADKQETSKSAQAKVELLDALKRAETSKTATEKAADTKSTGPADELQKVAAELAAADQEALVKEAQFYGAAVADGFMARLQQYEKAADTIEAPVEKNAEVVDVEKIAEEAVRGYVETQTAIKTAVENEFARGYNDTMKEVEKIAADVFTQGYQECASVLAQLS